MILKASRFCLRAWITLGLFFLFPGVPEVKAQRSSGVVRGIRYLTAESTLLPLIRQHDLVDVLEQPDEAAALRRLRSMIDITESADGRSLEIGVLSGDAALDGLLTNALADSGTRMPAEEPELSTEEIQEIQKVQQDLANALGTKVRQLIRDRGIWDPPPLKVSGPEVTENPADKAVMAEWNAYVGRIRARQAELLTFVDEEVKTKMAAPFQPTDDPDYLRAKRAWRQQVAVVQHLDFLHIEARIRESAGRDPAAQGILTASQQPADGVPPSARPPVFVRRSPPSAVPQPEKILTATSAGSSGPSWRLMLLIQVLGLLIGFFLYRRRRKTRQATAASRG